MFCKFFLRSNNVTQIPFLPALPVRPALWIKGYVFLGGSSWITKPTLSMSSPLDATSVAIRIFLFPFLKALRLNSLSFWDISPCKNEASFPNYIASSVT